MEVTRIDNAEQSNLNSAFIVNLKFLIIFLILKLNFNIFKSKLKFEKLNFAFSGI